MDKSVLGRSSHLQIFLKIDGMNLKRYIINMVTLKFVGKLTLAFQNYPVSEAAL